MKAISVTIGDAEVLVRRGLKSILSEHDNIEVIGEAGNEEDLLVNLATTPPNVVILDYSQTDFFDHTTVLRVKEISPASEILIICSDDDKSRIYSVIENGVNSYLTKQCDEGEIIDALKALSKGEKFYCHKILDLLVKKSFPSKHMDPSEMTPLTPREKEILSMVAEGKTAKEIAFDLSLSHHTVYTHRKNILKKLGMSSPTEMIVYAIENGLVPIK